MAEVKFVLCSGRVYCCIANEVWNIAIGKESIIMQTFGTDPNDLTMYQLPEGKYCNGIGAIMANPSPTYYLPIYEVKWVIDVIKRRCWMLTDPFSRKEYGDPIFSEHNWVKVILPIDKEES